MVVSELEDDFHHFVVTLRHDGERSSGRRASRTAGRGRRARTPPSRCRALAGMPLSRRFTAAGAWTDPKQNCTHQFDAACHAITHAARGGAVGSTGSTTSRSRAATPRPTATHVRLWVDGALRLDVVADVERHRRPASRRSTRRRGAAGSCAGPTRRSRRTTPSARSRCGARATSAWAAAWTSTASRSRPSSRVDGAASATRCSPASSRSRAQRRGSIRDFASHPEQLLAD